MKIPKVGIIPVTYQCNAKCAMCNIWDGNYEKDMPLEKLVDFFRDPLISGNIQSVNLTGGEPTLRRDIVLLAKEILTICTQLSSITLNTNGFNSERLQEIIKQMVSLQSEVRPYELIVYMSLDGLEQVHDQVRGVPGSFSKVMKSIEALQRLQEYVSFSFSINFTINPHNYHEMEPVYKLVTAKGLKLDYTYSMESGFYFNNSEKFHSFTNNSQAIEYICNTLAVFMKEGNLSNPTSYYRNLIKMIRGGKRVVGCIFTSEGFFMHPSGDIYRCWAYDKKLGNIYSDSFSDIWTNTAAVESADLISEKCEECYNNCYSNFKRAESIKNLMVSKGT